MKFNTNKSLINYALKSTEESRSEVSLICFANAGAGATVFRSWSKEFGDDIDVWGAAYPGRDTLLQKPAATTVDELVAYYLADISMFPDEGYVLYGHSFGALVAYTLALKLQALGRTPIALCIGARRAPCAQAREILDFSSDKKLINELTKLGGIPDALAKDKDMLAYFLPHIRNDLFLNETHAGKQVAKLDCPIFGFYSPADQLVLPEEVRGWSAYTNAEYAAISLEGGHFFINGSASVFFRELRNIIIKTTA